MNDGYDGVCALLMRGGDVVFFMMGANRTFPQILERKTKRRCDVRCLCDVQCAMPSAQIRDPRSEMPIVGSASMPCDAALRAPTIYVCSSLS